MGVKYKYERLYPIGSLLYDEVVLAQAWKKAHTYIRRHNWYADTLELDVSAVNLPSTLADWSLAISQEDYHTRAAWLVPAPKNGMWAFKPADEGGWGPRIAGSGLSPVLRPLAHIGIRDQCVAIAVMLCLADCVESAQGDTSVPPLEAANRRVYSYGNRLYCNWSSDGATASFAWGNSNTYSRYFQDYQRFVERPVAVAASAEAKGRANVFIVSLDLSAFFDNVRIDLLVQKLQDEYYEFAKGRSGWSDADQLFWRIARKALTFGWREEDESLRSLFKGEKLPMGLPQGLVASGFFSNAYLLDFDRKIGSVVGKRPRGAGFVLHDYCRYVDDLRLVVSVDVDTGEVDEARLSAEVSAWVQKFLTATTSQFEKKDSHLRLNMEKTELERVGETGGDSRLSSRMKALQKQLSGPFDVDALRQVEAGLNGLLSLAELGLMEDAQEFEHGLRLASIARAKLEVRDDTLTRFSAYRLSRSLRMRRSMTDLTEESDGKVAQESLLHDFQAAARRLVAAWAVNPSLVQVLKYALDLFPSVELLSPITQALLQKLSAPSPRGDYEKRVAYYVLAELFKAGATETGRIAAQDLSFRVADVEAYREQLTEVACLVLKVPDVPWYVQQQGSLLLSVQRIKSPTTIADEEFRLHRALESFVQGRCSDLDTSKREELAVSLVGHMLVDEVSHYRKWFVKFCERCERNEVSYAWTTIAENNPRLFEELLKLKAKGIQNLVNKAPRQHFSYLAARASSNEPLNVDRWIPLMTAISHPDAQFAQENALLKLALKLVTANGVTAASPELLNPLSVEVRSKDWRLLNDPRTDELEVRASVGSRLNDRRYETPSWCPPEDAWMYAIGRLLRAAATGEPDFTAHHWLVREESGWYTGVRSTWHKRRIGMLHAGDSLRGTAAAITPWFSDLLFALLCWPGIPESGSSALRTIDSREDLVRHLTARLGLQREIYGKSSSLPVYRYPVEWNLSRTRGLRVAIVQGLMPLQSHFAGGLKGLEKASYRAQHRNHTAALLHLASKHLAVRDHVLGCSSKPHFDLVVFPELTIHVDDQDLMRGFSDATGAMLFYGLLGAKDPITKDFVNAARWLVPQRRSNRRSWLEIDQGKRHLTPEEPGLGINPWRPYQVVIELFGGDVPNSHPYRLTGSICFDATDLSLAADLRDESHMYVVAAMNRDVKTFDGMVAALRYHMYQHVLIANIGEFGGSTAQAPYDKEHRRLIAHTHGSEQLAISVIDVRLEDFGPHLRAAAPGKKVKRTITERIGKAPPAGLRRRGVYVIPSP